MKKSNVTSNQLSRILGKQLLAGELKKLFITIDILIQEGGNEMLLSINRFLSIPFNLSVMIHYILKDETLLNHVQKESYYHENGFHKIVLGAGKSFKLRLHHFGSSAKIPMENIHDHRWAFASTILKGSLTMDLFTTTQDEGEKVLHYRYDSNKQDGAYTIEPLGYTRLKVIERKEYISGKQYLMSTTDLHRIINKPGEESMTLILTGKPISSFCNLYAKRTIKDEEKSPITYNRTTLLKMLSQLSENIYPTSN